MFLFRSCLLLSFILAVFNTWGQSLKKKSIPFPGAYLFIENRGQIVNQHGEQQPDVKYIFGDGKAFKLVLKQSGFSYEISKVSRESEISEATGKPFTDTRNNADNAEKVTINTQRVDIELVGANPNPEIIADGQSPVYLNYYKEYTPESGVTRARVYSQVTYKNIYDHIDFVFKKQDDGLKYDIVIRPGGKIEDIKLRYKGLSQPHLQNGELTILTANSKITEKIPYSFIVETGENVSISYRLERGMIRFNGSQPVNKTLVVDPLLIWGTYFGGEEEDFSSAQIEDLPTDAARDKSGNIYFSGMTSSTANIATSGAFQVNYQGKLDAFLAKINDTGSIQWATYFGGSEQDYAGGLAIDLNNDIYLTGSTESSTGIATTGAHQSSYAGGGDVFLVKFNASGGRIWSTYFGGSSTDNRGNVATDAQGNVYLSGNTGSSSGISTPGAYKSNRSSSSADIFLAKLDKSGKQIWGTYFGGDEYESIERVSVDARNYIYIGGYTEGSLNISTSGAHQTVFGGGYSDAFLAKFNSSGGIEWSTYYGGSKFDYALSVSTDDSAYVYLAGDSYSSTGIATTGAYQESLNGNAPDAFLAKFNSNGVRIWATYYGGPNEDGGENVITDKEGNVYLSGGTRSTSDIATPNAYKTFLSDYGDGYAVKFNKNGKRIWGTYFGGDSIDFVSRIFPDGNDGLFLMGETYSTSGIATSGSYQSDLKGTIDLYIARIGRKNDAMVKQVLISKNDFCGAIRDSIRIKIGYEGDSSLSSLKIGYTLNSKPGKTIVLQKNDLTDTSRIFSLDTASFLPGVTALTVWTSLPNGADDNNANNDTFRYTVTVHPRPTARFTALSRCEDSSIDFVNNSTVSNITGDSITSYFWNFGDNKTSTLSNPTHFYNSAGTYKVTLVTITNHGCSDTLTETISVYAKPNAEFDYSSVGKLLTLKPKHKYQSASYAWNFGDGNSVTDTFADSVQHTYSTIGNYIVKLRITTKEGCSDSIAKSVAITLTGIAHSPSAVFGISTRPNPFQDDFELDYTLGSECVITASVLDLSGKQVLLPVYLNGKAGMHTHHIAFGSGISKPGIYLLRINVGNEVYFRKLVKM